MPYRSIANGDARESVVSSLPRRRAPGPRLLVAPLLALLLAACSGGEQAVNSPPPGSDPAPGPSAELTGEGPSGVVAGHALQGVLWNDSDGDGVFGLGDSVLSNAQIMVELEDGETVTVVTDGVGQYRVDGLAPGTSFKLRHRLPPTFTTLSTERGSGPSAASEQIVKHYVWQ
ncbi:MAG TPA: SdrD B-like domain-containing protein [Trueperaceae bacterium]